MCLMKKQKSPPCHFFANRKAGLLAGLALCLPLFMAAPAFGASGPAADFSEGQRNLDAAGKDLQKAEKEFAAAGNVVDEGTTGRTTWSQLGDSAAEQAQPEAEAPAEAGKSPQAKRQPAKMPGAQVTSNTAPGYDGYMGTYVDPDNGDIVTSVIAPTRRNQNQDYQNYLIIIEPDVSGWGNNWNNGWNNSGWAGPHGPGQQVPGYPYPPAYPGFQPSGQVPGYPFPPSPPGYGPAPPPPNGPNYAPSLPGQGNPPGNPNNPGGLMPPVPPPGPGFGPGPAINPPVPPKPNFGPGYPPLLPPQSGPGNRPGFGHGPNFGHRPGFGHGPNFGHRPGFGHGPNFGHRPGFGHGPNFGHRPGFGPGPNFGHRPGFGPGMRPGFGHGPNFGHKPGFGPGMRPGPGFRPHTELTPPKNPGRPGSMPLVSPNFPPKVQHQPFVDLYRAPDLQTPQQNVRHPGVASMEIAPHQPYFVPGSAQSWEASNWQPGKP